MLLKLEEIVRMGAKDQQPVGGKGRGLLEIAKIGLPYPKTWVVPSTIFAEFAAGLPGSVAADEIEAKARQFAAGVLAGAAGQLPEGIYAVRSSALVEDSAEYSFAGMFESKLNVRNADLPQALAQVWLSGLGKRVREYTKSSEWPEMAVLIQMMITARFSGVCFSRHPSPGTVRQNGQYLIELVSGCGEQLVQGEVSPVRLTGSYGALAACSDYPWMPELLAAVSRLEAAADGPVDVEFAVDAGEHLWLLQQRPVTKLYPSLALSLQGYKKAYKRALCSLDIEFLIDGCARHLASYLEVPVDLTGWMVMLTNEKDGQQELWINQLADSAVISYLAEMFGSARSHLERLKIRYDHHHRRILNWRDTAWADQSLPLTVRLQDLFEFIVPLNAHYYAPMLIIEALSVLLLDAMRRIDPEKADDDFFVLSASGISTLGSDFAAEITEIYGSIKKALGRMPEELSGVPADLREKVKELAEEYGFLNCHQPYEQPYSVEYVFNLVRAVAPGAAAAEDTPPMTTWEKYRSDPKWDGLYNSLVHWLQVRNRQMEYLYYAYAKAAPLLTAVGEQLGLSLEEVWNSDRTTLLDSLAGGAKRPDPCQRDRLTLFHNGREVVLSDRLKVIYPDSGGAAGGLKGKTVFGSGELNGTVKVAFTPEELGAAGSLEGIIVVTGMTTPDFVPFLKQAAGLITDEGGILCHAAIIAREIRIPCLVGTGLATERLEDGRQIKLDLDRGELTLLS